jgi:hypothetical protein
MGKLLGKRTVHGWDGNEKTMFSEVKRKILVM